MTESDEYLHIVNYWELVISKSLRWIPFISIIPRSICGESMEGTNNVTPNSPPCPNCLAQTDNDPNREIEFVPGYWTGLPWKRNRSNDEI